MKNKVSKSQLFLIVGILFLTTAVYAGAKFLPGLVSEAENESSAPTASSGRDTSVPVASSAIGNIDITPVYTSSLGVEVNSPFVVKTKDTISKDLLFTYLSIKTGENFTIDEVDSSSNEYLLSFENELENDKIYNFIYSEPEKHPLSFAFQTESDFGIIATVPGNAKYYVPVESGIEIAFNDKIDGDFSDYFSIDPYTDGTFDIVGNTYIFIPERLEYNTKYTVTIKSGLLSQSGKILSNDYQLTFHTNWVDGEIGYSISGGISETFLSSDDIFIKMYLSDFFVDGTFDVEIYDLITPENYIACSKQSVQSITIPDNAALLETLTTELFVVNNGNALSNDYYIMLHKTLENGYYLIDIKTTYDNKDYTAKKLIQVTGLSVYSVSLEGETCFWINDSSTGIAAQNAKINIGGSTVSTDSAGTVTIKTIEDDSANVAIDYGNYPTYVYNIPTFNPKILPVDEKYYSYIYTDRDFYKPTDTIDVFGVIKERIPSAKLSASDEIILKFGDMTENKVTLDKYGAFAAKIPIRDMIGSSDIKLCINGEILTSASVRFLNYPKNKYMVSVETDQCTYFVGETAEISASVNTYDNSPVEGVEIISETTGGENFITDNDGIAATSTKIGRESTESTGTPFYRDLWFYLSGHDDYAQSASAEIVVLPSDVYFTYEASLNSIEFSTNAIDRDAIETYIRKPPANSHSLEANIYKGRPVDMTFSIDIYEITKTREQVGESYDFIQKVTVPQYEYTDKEVFFDTYTAATVNGKAVISDLPASDDIYVSYYGIVKFTDTRGNHLYFRVYYGSDQDLRTYTEKMFGFKIVDDDSNYYNRSFKVNETLTVGLHSHHNDNEAIPAGKMITILTRDSILSTTVGDSSGVPVLFTEDCVSNVYLFGAYFDGKYIYPVQYPLIVSYDSSEKRLNLEITNDKETYNPGDKVHTTIQVTDENGRPKKSLVNISVVDETVFNQLTHKPDFLANYYNSIAFYNKPYYVYSSYSQYFYSVDGNSGAEKGGGGDNTSIRDDFRDNPAFISVETDNKGVANFDYTLADTITSWRISAHAISKDNDAGNGYTNIISTLPYYIDMVVLDEFVAGDEISVVVKSLGEQYQLNKTNVAYDIEILQSDKVIFSDHQESSSPVTFNAGKLAIGEYSMRVKGTCGNYTDAMEEKFSVAESSIMLPLETEQIISSEQPLLTSLDITGSPVKLTITNGDMALILDTLYSCMNFSTKRTDEKAGTSYANYFLDNLYDKKNTSPYAEGLLTELNWYNGMPELVYGDGELLYTARFAGCFPELIKKDDLLSFIIEKSGMYEDTTQKVRNMVSEESSDAYAENMRAAGYFALAAAGENVLLEINNQIDIIKNAENQNIFKEDYNSHLRILYYAAALCAIGDDAGANGLISLYVPAQTIFSSSADEKEKALRTEYINTMMLFINTTIAPTNAYTYLSVKEDNLYVSDVCEKINFIKKAVPLSGVTSEITYDLNGKTNTAKFVNFDRLTLEITKEQFEKLNLKQLAGNTAIKIVFNGSASNLIAENKKIEIEKEIVHDDLAASKNLYTVKLAVILPEDAQSGYYTIRDRVPSNMRYTEITDSNNNNKFYVSNTEKQLVDIYFYFDGNNKNMNVYYNTILVNDAQSVQDNAYISKGFRLDQIWGY